MIGIIKKIFVTPHIDNSLQVGGAYRVQIRHLKEVWHDLDYASYGIERLFRLFLVLVQFLFPMLLIRSLFTRYGILGRKLAVELYMVLKLAFPLVVLNAGLYHNTAVVAIVIYLLSETVTNLLGMIFLIDIYPVTLTYRRSIILILLEYINVMLMYSVIYIGFNLLNNPLTPVSAVYFSLVTIASVGYGDYHPRDGAGQMVVISEVILFVLFLSLFINHFATKTEDKGV